MPGRCTKYNVSTPSPNQARPRLLRKREAAGGGGSFLWRMPPNTTSNGLLYDPLFPGATAARSVSPSPRVGGTRCDRGGDSPRTWPLVASLARVDRGGESLSDVRQRRRTSTLRGECGVTFPCVGNSQELSCTQAGENGRRADADDKTNSTLAKSLASDPLRSLSETAKPTMF